MRPDNSPNVNFASRLLNVGMKEISKRFNAELTCLAQHDVDLLPNLDTVNYGWWDKPTQLCTGFCCLGNKFPYAGSCVGGVMTASLADWPKISEHTLHAHGRGAEDDEIYNRFRNNNLIVTSNKYPKHLPLRRPQEGCGQCDCFGDGRDEDHTPRVESFTVYNKMMNQLKRMRSNSSEWMPDGLSNAEYEVLDTFEDAYGSAQFQVNYTINQWSPPTPEFDPRGPLPVILLSQGRSGSTGIFQAITNLTGGTVPATEYVGRNPKILNIFC